jgi:hypothetical protein
VYWDLHVSGLRNIKFEQNVFGNLMGSGHLEERGVVWSIILNCVFQSRIIGIRLSWNGKDAVFKDDYKSACSITSM